MAIAKMNKIYLLGHQEEKDKALSILQQSAMVEIDEIQTGDAAVGTWAELLDTDQEQETLQGLEARLTEVRFALDFLGRHYPPKKSFLDALSSEKKDILPEEFATSAVAWSKVANDVYAVLRQAEEKIMSLRNEGTQLQNLKTILSPWEMLTAPLEEIRATELVCMEAITLPLVELASLRDDLLTAIGEVYLSEVSIDRNEAYLFLAYPVSRTEELQKVVKQFNLSRQTFPALNGTVAENLVRIEAEMAMLGSKREKVVAGTEKQVEFRQTLEFYQDYLTMERDKKEKVGSLARTGDSFAVEGWMAEKDFPLLEKKLATACPTVTLVSRQPETEEMPPVVLENTASIAPFEFITTLYGTPHPRGIDPTSALTPFFVVFFGLCLSDAGYGLILTALAALVLWKVKLSKMASKAFWVILASGVSTIIFGSLIGGWFGGLLPIEPFFFNAQTDPMRMLAWSLGIGIFQIFVGMGIKAYRNICEGKIMDAVSDQLFWILLISGLILFAGILPGLQMLGRNLALLSAAGLVLTQGRTQKNIVMKFLSGLFSLYNITGFLGDILSYSRLLALGLATSVIAMAINMIGQMVGEAVPIIGPIIMVGFLIGGHIFNLVINILGAFVHSTRLQYLEFFNRFFETGGKPFNPFQMETKHLEVRE
ncbi:V-type ATP synthase subunit I [candidate division NPL-UPA2 bacterium]|nr:V-type ATP synthase subunit I [candidate division NPL-UPA2 bacterium]